jgi:hypothetical protein
MRVSVSDPPAPSAAADPQPLPLARSAGQASPSFAEVLRGLGREINGGETTMRTAIHSMSAGADLGPARLIALQVGVYRYSEAIELTSRLVDRATGGVKTIVQGGGQ